MAPAEAAAAVGMLSLAASALHRYRLLVAAYDRDDLDDLRQYMEVAGVIPSEAVHTLTRALVEGREDGRL